MRSIAAQGTSTGLTRVDRRQWPQDGVGAHTQPAPHMCCCVVAAARLAYVGVCDLCLPPRTLMTWTVPASLLLGALVTAVTDL